MSTFNLANVKAWSIPEGSVKQVTDSNGVILWGAVATSTKLYSELQYVGSQAEYSSPYHDYLIPLKVSIDNYTAANHYTEYKVSNDLGYSNSGSQFIAIIRGNTFNINGNSTTTTSNLSMPLMKTSMTPPTNYWTWGTSTGNPSGPITNDKLPHIYKIHGQTFTYDNTIISSALTEYIHTSCSYYHASSTNNVESKFYYLKTYLSDNTTLTNNLVPCIRNFDQMPGIYNLVTGEFSSNANSVKGSVVTLNPTWSPNNDIKYYDIEYIQFTGNQYFDFIYPYPGLGIAIEMDIDTPSSDVCLAGCSSGRGDGYDLEYVITNQRYPKTRYNSTSYGTATNYAAPSTQATYYLGITARWKVSTSSSTYSIRTCMQESTTYSGHFSSYSTSTSSYFPTSRLAIGAKLDWGSNTISTSMGISGKFYSIIIGNGVTNNNRQTPTSWTMTNGYTPVLSSDGQIGLFSPDTLNFIPLRGTYTVAQNAGPQTGKYFNPDGTRGDIND